MFYIEYRGVEHCIFVVQMVVEMGVYHRMPNPPPPFLYVREDS